MSIFTALLNTFKSWSTKTLEEGRLIHRFTDDHHTNKQYDYQGITRGGHLILFTHKSPCNKFIIGKDSFNRIYYFNKHGRCISLVDKNKFIVPDDKLHLKSIKRYKYNELRSNENNPVK